MKYKIIFIDIDNTLLDFDKYVQYALKTGFEHFHLVKYEDNMYQTFKTINSGLWLDLEKGLLTFEQLKAIRFNKIFEVLGIDFDGVIFEKYFRDTIYNYAEPVDGAISLVKSLSKLAPIALASNGPFDQQVHRISISELKDYISYYFISEKIGYSKPAKEFFEIAFEEINKNNKDKILPNECVMIGDSLTSDMQGGINVGMSTIYFNKHQKENNTSIKPDLTFNKLEDIEKYMLSI